MWYLKWTLKYGWNFVKKRQQQKENLGQRQEGEIFRVDLEDNKQSSLNGAGDTYTGVEDDR